MAAPIISRTMQKYYFKAVVISVVLFTLTTFSGSGILPFFGHNLKFALVIVLYGISSYYILSLTTSGKEKAIALCVFFILPFISLTSVFWLAISKGVFMKTSVSWPSSIAYPLALLLGSLSVRWNNYKFIIWFASLVLSLFMLFWGYDYYVNYLNFRTFTGRTEEEAPKFSFRDNKDNIFANDEFAKRTVVLDFWFTKCRYCLEDMPRFEELFQKYGRDGQILFYSVNCPLTSDSAGHARYILEEYGFHFPLLFSSDSTIKQLKISTFPTYIVLKNDKIIFRGCLRDLESIMDDI